MPYIPDGCDQQSRLPTRVWLPRRVEPGFEQTYPTAPAPLAQPEAAHAASEHDDFLAVNELKQRAANRIFGWLSAACIVLLVAVLAAEWWK